MKSCKQCDEYDVCSRQNDLRRKKPRCPKAKTDKPMTNYDRLISKTPEELAEILGDCPPNYPLVNCRKYEKSDGNLDCCKCWLDWLKSPVESDDGKI